MVLLTGEHGRYFKCIHCNITEKVGAAKGKGKAKMNRHETRRLLKKVNQEDAPGESALAQALKTAMAQKKS